MTSRRGFIASAFALLAAPAIVRAHSLMPVSVQRPSDLLLPDRVIMVGPKEDFQTLQAAWQYVTSNLYLGTTRIHIQDGVYSDVPVMD